MPTRTHTLTPTMICINNYSFFALFAYSRRSRAWQPRARRTTAYSTLDSWYEPCCISGWTVLLDVTRQCHDPYPYFSCFFFRSSYLAHLISSRLFFFALHAYLLLLPHLRDFCSLYLTPHVGLTLTMNLFLSSNLVFAPSCLTFDVDPFFLISFPDRLILSLSCLADTRGPACA